MGARKEGGSQAGPRNCGSCNPAHALCCTQPGTIMAASNRFRVVVRGRGGHGAMPHQTADPVLVGAMIVVALQPLVSRETAPTDGAVVTVARFNTGTNRIQLSYLT
jgi:metal-dependent amidase/aminoacylase/carboxypeptidase family protein